METVRERERGERDAEIDVCLLTGKPHKNPHVNISFSFYDVLPSFKTISKKKKKFSPLLTLEGWVWGTNSGDDRRESLRLCNGSVALAKSNETTNYHIHGKENGKSAASH